MTPHTAILISVLAPFVMAGLIVLVVSWRRR